jgi:hypothetical protein
MAASLKRITYVQVLNVCLEETQNIFNSINGMLTTIISLLTAHWYCSKAALKQN